MYHEWPYAEQFAIANAPAVSSGKNLLYCSERLDAAAYWTVADATVTATGTTAPIDGVQRPKYRLVEGDATTTHSATQAIYDAITIGTVTTLSVYVARTARPWIAIGVHDGTTYRYAYFDILNHVVGSKHAFFTSSTYGGVLAGTGLRRLSVTFTAAITAVSAKFADASADGTVAYDGDPATYSLGNIITCPQWEAGASATTYEPGPLPPAPSAPILVTWKPGMRQDFRDLRWRDPRTLEANEWHRDTYTAGVSALITVAVQPGQTHAEMLYGHGAAVDGSNGAAVYPDLYDDFTGAVLDTATTWTNAGGASVTVAGGICAIAGANTNTDSIVTQATFGPGYACRIQAKFAETAGSALYGWHAATGESESECAVAYNTDGYRFTTYTTAYDNDGENPDTNWHLDEIARNGGASVIFTRDGAVAHTATTQLPTGALPVGAHQYASGYSLSLDWIAVLPYTATPPALTRTSAGLNPWSIWVQKFHAWPSHFAPPIAASFTTDVTSGAAPLPVTFTDTSTVDTKLIGRTLIRFSDVSLSYAEQMASYLPAEMFHVEIVDAVENVNWYWRDFTDDGSWHVPWPLIQDAVTLCVWDHAGVVSSYPGGTIGTQTYVLPPRTEYDAGEWEKSGQLLQHELLHTVEGLESSDDLRVSGGFLAWLAAEGDPVPGFTAATRETYPIDNEILDYFYTYLTEAYLADPALHSHQITYAWDFGDGRISTLQNPVHTYWLGGAHGATLTVTSPWTSNTSAATTITVEGAVPASGVFADQKVISWTVRRSASDVMYAASVDIEGLVEAGLDFKRISMYATDWMGKDHRIFFGFLPAQTSRISAAANKTHYDGWDYGFYIASRSSPIDMCTMPSTTASPGAWMKNYFEEGPPPYQWPDLSDLTRPLFDTSHIDANAPVAWGTAAMPVRDIVTPVPSKVMAVMQKVEKETGCIFYPRWIDLGTTPTLNHQDLAYRIIRVEAEDYDETEGTGYSDTTAGNTGGAYRSDDVDIEFTQAEQGYNVGWIRDGEWLRYTVTIPTLVTGDWTAKFRTASAAADGVRSFKVYWGTNPASLSLIEDIAVDGTGSYTTFVVNTDEATLPVAVGGTHYLKLVFDDAGDDATDLLHMNIASIDLYPPPAASPAAERIVPAIYWCDEADLDAALDLDPVTIDGWCPTLVKDSLRYTEDFSSVANAVIVRYRTPEAPDVLLEWTDWVDDWNGLEGVIDHVETVDTPISTATAQALCEALIGYYSEKWGTLTATFTARPDLQLFQKIHFADRVDVPDLEDDGITPVWFRITEIVYSGSLAACSVSITAIPARKFSIERQLQRTRAPDPATEIEAMAEAVVKSQPKPLTGTVTAVGTGTVTVSLDRGGTIAAHGQAAVNSRVLCVYAEGIGYVAAVVSVPA